MQISVSMQEAFHELTQDPESRALYDSRESERSVTDRIVVGIRRLVLAWQDLWRMKKAGRKINDASKWGCFHLTWLGYPPR